MKHLNQSIASASPTGHGRGKQNCAAMCCAAMCCAALRCAALRCAALRRAVLCCAVRYGMVWYGMVWFVAHCTLTCPGQAAELVACIIWTALSYNMHSRATYYHYRASERSSE